MEWYELVVEIPSRGQSSEELVGLILVLRPSSDGSWLDVVRWARGRREFIILEDVEARRSKEDAVVLLLLLLSFGAIFIFVEV